MTTLSQAAAIVVADIASVPCVDNGTVGFLLQLTNDINFGQQTAKSISLFVDQLLAIVGASSNFAAGLDPLVLIGNVNNLVALTNAAPFVLEAANQFGYMAKQVDLVQN